MNFVERMLDSQRAVMIPIDDLREELQTCMDKYEVAFLEANRRLSRENEQGLPVVHGCRIVLDIYVNYWLARIQAIWNVLSRETTREYQDTVQLLYSYFNFHAMKFNEEYAKQIRGL